MEAITPPGKTVSEILETARRDMELADAQEDWLAGRAVRQLRHPRRELRAWLRRRNEPVAELITSEPEALTGRPAR